MVYINDILVFIENLEDYYDHLLIVFNEVVNNRVIISKKKIKLYKECIEFLGMKIEKGKIKLQEHIGKKILKY